MSGLAVAFRRQGPAADESLLDRMLAAAAYRGPDGATKWLDGAIALGHLSLVTTAEARDERQPAREDGVAVVFDGRLDARDALRSTLEARGARLRDDTDVELVLHAYLAFGEGFARQLVGDYAIAVWDVQARALLLARDPFGARPLHYYVDDELLVAGSDLSQILEHRGLVRAPNEGVVAELLAGIDNSPSETLFVGVRRLLPGHTLRVDSRSVRTSRHWSPDNVPAIRHRTDDDYAQHFAAVFDDAIRASLRASSPVAVDLSGGLDSSSIAARARCLGASIASFSHVYAGEPHDERTWSRLVVERWPGEHHELPSGPRPVSEAAEQARAFRDLPNPPNSTTEAQLSARRAIGARVRIAGLGGDELLDPMQLTSVAVDLLRRGRLRELRSYPPELWPQAVVRAAIPNASLRWLRGRLRPSSIPPWLDPGLVQRTDLRARIERARSPIAGRADVERRFPYADGARIRATEQEERLAARHGLELRSPFAYRPLVELVLGMPSEQLLRPELTKVVLRKAMRGVLPEAVRTRDDKAYFAALYRAELASQPGPPVAIGDAGWIVVGRISAAAELLHARWMNYALEQWFRASF